MMKWPPTPLRVLSWFLECALLTAIHVGVVLLVVDHKPTPPAPVAPEQFFISPAPTPPTTTLQELPTAQDVKSKAVVAISPPKSAERPTTTTNNIVSPMQSSEKTDAEKLADTPMVGSSAPIGIPVISGSEPTPARPPQASAPTAPVPTPTPVPAPTPEPVEVAPHTVPTEPVAKRVIPPFTMSTTVARRDEGSDDWIPYDGNLVPPGTLIRFHWNAVGEAPIECALSSEFGDEERLPPNGIKGVKASTTFTMVITCTWGVNDQKEIHTHRVEVQPIVGTP